MADLMTSPSPEIDLRTLIAMEHHQRGEARRFGEVVGQQLGLDERQLFHLVGYLLDIETESFRQTIPNQIPAE